MKQKIICVVFLCILKCIISKDCKSRDQCSCAFDDDNSVIDLTSLGKSDDTPNPGVNPQVVSVRFGQLGLIPGLISKQTYVDGKDGSKYSYNPCYPFDEGSCNDAAVCMSDKGQTTQTGDADSVEFGYDEQQKIVQVGYTSGTGLQTITIIDLICDQSALTPTLNADGALSQGLYHLVLTSVCACPNGCTASGPAGKPHTKGGHGEGLGVGSYICIIFFSLCFLYCIIGGVFMKVRRKAVGKEIVPNVTFWEALPGLMKDGFGFLKGKVQKKKGGYSDI